MKTPSRHYLKTLWLPVAAAHLFTLHSASAVPVLYIGTNGVSATTNWSDESNWSLAGSLATPQNPANNAANFAANTAVNAPGLITVNVDGSYGSPGSSPAQSYGAFFGFTNGYHTVLIQPGITWIIQSASGTQGIGIEVGPQTTNNNNINNANTVSTGATYTNYTTISGIGGILYNNAGASAGGVRVEAASTTVNNHYSILDLSGLGTYIQTNNGGLGNSCSFYVVNGGQNSQGLAYLALTNVITLNNSFQVGYLGASSNSLPIGVYLGQSNYITTGANNNTFIVGDTGCTNAFLKFNPAFLGGASLPTAYISGTGSNQNALIASAVSGKVAGYAICDFTGGEVTWIGNSLKIGVSGNAVSNTAANGALTFDNGLVSFNTIVVGDQSVSNGAPGVGTINVGSNATLAALSAITLGAVTGATNAGTAGTINVNYGALQSGIISNGGAGSAINITNGNLEMSLAGQTYTNITVSNFNAGGSTNLITITSIPAYFAGNYPVRYHLISTSVATNLTGASTFGLGPLPTNSDSGAPYEGTIDTSTPGLVDLVLTSGPPAVGSLTWTGLNAGSPDGIWDVGANDDWENNGAATFFNQYDLVNFYDVASPAQTQVSLTTTLLPASIMVSNNTSIYTIGLSSDAGSISGTTGLTKQGSGALILDNAVSNTFTGAVTINGGVLQLGDKDAAGSLPYGAAVTDNSILACDRSDIVTIGNVISGSGQVISEGGGTLELTGGNSFTGNALITNGSILQNGSAGALGATGGTLIIANGSTYDPNGSPTARSIIVSGTGVNGEGAIVNSGGPIYDSGVALSPSITLAGDTTFSFPTRWDYGLQSGVETLSAGGQPYNLTLNGTANNSYFEWRDIAADPGLGNINVVAGYFGIVGTTTLGSTNYSLNVLAGAYIKLYTFGSNVYISKPVALNDSASFLNETGANTIAGPLILTNTGGQLYCVITVLPTSLTVTGPVSGDGVLWLQASSAPLIIDGNASGLSGGALISAGGIFVLNNIIGSGVTNAPGSTLAGDGTVTGYTDVSGTLIPGYSNVVGTFTAAGGLTLEASSVPILNLSAVTNAGGTNNSLLAVTGDLNVLGNPILYLNPLGTLADGTYTLMTYSGALNGTFGGAQTLTNSSYTLALNTSTPGLVQVTVGGAPVPASFANSFTLSGSTLTLSGTSGTPNGTYRVYATTNLALPLPDWTEVGSGSFDAGGNFSFPTTVTNGEAQFFMLEEP